MSYEIKPIKTTEFERDGVVTKKAEAVVSFDSAPLVFSKFKVPREVTSDDKYTAIILLDESTRNLLIQDLTPVVVEMASIQGLKGFTEDAVKKLLGKKIDESDHGDDGYCFAAASRMAFEKDGEMVIQPLSAIQVNEDGTTEPLKTLLLTDESEACLNAVVKPGYIKNSTKPTIMIHLGAIAVTKVVGLPPREKTDNGSRPEYNDFKGLNSDY